MPKAKTKATKQKAQPAKRARAAPSRAAKSRVKKTQDDRVYVFDTTLRDGEQSPGASMTLEEKLQIAQMLDKMGVDIIEAGFPIASEGDFEAVRQIAKCVQKSVVCGLARASEADIRRAHEAVRDAKRPRIHTFISTSPVHMKHKLKMTAEEVLEAIEKSVGLARNLTDDVEWSPEDGTRTEHDFLCRSVETAIRAGASTINIPDTVGYSVPDEIFDLFSMVRQRVPNSDQARFSIHCHNDLGLAVANSLAAISAGARQVECTINGLGERAGNAALEEVVMALRVRKDRMPYVTEVETKEIAKISKLVSGITAFPVQYNKAIVGRNAFSHESGIHQDGMIKNAQTYEIMRPETVGVHSSSLVMGKLSGRNAFAKKLAELGYDNLGDNAFAAAFARFKALADKKRHIYDEDIIALVDDSFARGDRGIHLVSLDVQTGSEGPNKARLVLQINDEEKTAEVEGNGAVDAIFGAIREIVPHDAKLALYQVHAVTGGSDAQAEVSVRLEERGQSAYGKGAHTDTLVASARGYISALNKLREGGIRNLAARGGRGI